MWSSSIFDGRTHSGIIKEKNERELTLMTSEGNLDKISVDEIDIMRQGNSSMPDDLIKKMSRQDLRDLIEFLSRQKGDATDSAPNSSAAK